MQDALREQGWTSVPDSQANFVWLRLGDRTADFAAACEAAGVVVRPFAGEGARVTIGEPEANDLFLRWPRTSSPTDAAPWIRSACARQVRWSRRATRPPLLRGRSGRARCHAPSDSGSALGAGFRDGGLHPRFGTRNFVLPLANGVYLEVVAALDHPAADKAPFGQAVKARTEAGGGWLAWVVAVDDIAPIEARLGRAAVDGHRRRPDGVDLSWRQIGVLDLLDDPALPFFIQWKSDAGAAPVRRPATATRPRASPRSRSAATRRRSATGSASRVARADFQIDWVDDDDPGLAAVHFSTAHGVVRID